MTSALLAIVYMFATPADWAAPEPAAALALFEGEWGYVSREPADDWSGQGFAGGAGACGGEKALHVDIREQPLPDGGEPVLLIRMHPEAEGGLSVTELEVIDDRNARLTAQLFGGDGNVFERSGDTLTMARGSARITFERCE